MAKTRKRRVRRKKPNISKKENDNDTKINTENVEVAVESVGGAEDCNLNNQTEPTMKEPRALALFTVFNKKGVSELARFLHGEGYEIISCGGTLLEIQRHDIPCKDVSEIINKCDVDTTQLLGGRLKTLQPVIHGGILAVNDEMSELRDYGISPINFVICNTAPIINKDIQTIDIGGCCLIRSAAKNYKRVTVVTDPSDYATVTKELLESGVTSLSLRAKLAKKSLLETGQYDTSLFVPQDAIHDRADSLYSYIYSDDVDPCSPAQRFSPLCDFLSNSDLRREIPFSDKSAGAYFSNRRSVKKRRSNPGSTVKEVEFCTSSEDDTKNRFSIKSSDFSVRTPRRLRKCLVSPGSKSSHGNQHVGFAESDGSDEKKFTNRRNRNKHFGKNLKRTSTGRRSHVEFATESDTGDEINFQGRPFIREGRDKRYASSKKASHVDFATESDAGDDIHFEDRPFPHKGRDSRYGKVGIPAKRYSTGRKSHVGFVVESDTGEHVHFEDRPFSHEGRDKRYSDFGIPTGRSSTGQKQHVEFATESDAGDDIHFEDRPFPHEGRDRRYSDLGIPTKRKSTGRKSHVGFVVESDTGEHVHFEDRPFSHEGRDKRYSDFGIPTGRSSTGQKQHVEFATESDAGDDIHFENRPFPHEGRDRRYSDFGIPTKRKSTGRKSHVGFVVESDTGEHVHFEDRPFSHEGRDKRYSDFGIPTGRSSTGQKQHVEFATESDIGEDVHFEDRPFPHEGRDRRYRDLRRRSTGRKSHVGFATESDVGEHIHFEDRPMPHSGRDTRYSDFGLQTTKVSTIKCVSQRRSSLAKYVKDLPNEQSKTSRMVVDKGSGHNFSRDINFCSSSDDEKPVCNPSESRKSQLCDYGVDMTHVFPRTDAKRKSLSTPACKQQKLRPSSSASNYITASPRFTSLKQFIEGSGTEIIIPTPERRVQIDSTPKRLSPLTKYIGSVTR